MQLSALIGCSTQAEHSIEELSYGNTPLDMAELIEVVDGVIRRRSTEVIRRRSLYAGELARYAELPAGECECALSCPQDPSSDLARPGEAVSLMASDPHAGHDMHERGGWARAEDAEGGAGRSQDAESSRDEAHRSSRGASSWAGREVLIASDKLLDRVLAGLPSMHTLLGLAPVCRRWCLAARRVEKVHGVLDCSPYPLMTDAELLFLVRRYRRVVKRLVLCGYDMAA